MIARPTRFTLGFHGRGGGLPPRPGARQNRKVSDTDQRPILRTARFELRPVVAADVDELHRLFADYDVRYYLCDGNDFGREWVAEVVEKSQRLFTEHHVGLWSARPLGEKEIAGVVGFFEFAEPPALELLYALFPAHWRAGKATELAEAVITHGVEQGIEPVRASVDAPNAASLRVLARLGFEETHREPADPPRTKWEQVHHVLAR